MTTYRGAVTPSSGKPVTYSLDEWLGDVTATYASATSFTVSGDQTGTFHVGRRVKLTDSSTLYGTITATAYTSLTTVTVVLDSGSITTALTTADYGVISTVNTSSVSPLSFESKASLVTETPVNNKLYWIAGSDGGLFKGVTGASAATYSDNGGSYCGTQFIPTGGDGSSAWLRVDGGYNAGLGHDPIWYGAAGDGTTDDLTPLTNCFAQGNVDLSDLTYLTSGEIQYVDGSRIRGVAGTNNSSIIKVKDSSNITGAVLVSKAYKDNATTAAAPTHITNVYINGNSDNQASGTCHGILLMNYRSVVGNNEIYKTTGDGIYLSDQNSASTSITGTAVENRIFENIITNVDGIGIYVDSNTNALTDGKIHDNVVASTGKEGIYCKRGSGWQIHDNQVYNIGFSGIRVDNGFHSSIRDNDIQGWGVSATTGTYYGAVIFSITSDDRPCSIDGNIISQNVSLVGGTTYYACGITSAASTTDVQASVINNTVTANSNASENFLNVTGSGVANVFVSGNTVLNINENKFISKNANDTIRHVCNSFDTEIRSLAGSGTPTVLHGCVFETSAGTITLSDLTNGYPGQIVKIIFQHSAYTVDFTGTNLKGNVGADWSPAVDDHMTCVCGSDGTTWYCDISDNTA